MKRIHRQDRMLLESLEDKYGTDAIATAIMTIANKQNNIKEKKSKLIILKAFFIFFYFICRIMKNQVERKWIIESLMHRFS